MQGESGRQKRFLVGYMLDETPINLHLPLRLGWPPTARATLTSGRPESELVLYL